MRTWAEISLDQLSVNYRNICSGVGPAVAVAGVVKANAYGHGAVPVSQTLVDAGAKWLAVSNTAEGIELRRAGLDVRILVLGGVLPFESAGIVEYNLTPVLHSLDELREWDALQGASRVPLKQVHIKVDTGMARLGMREEPSAIAAAIASLRHIRVEGLLSHFATPDDPVQSESQLTRFQEVLQVVEPEVVHFASSFALTERLKGAWLTLVRPGIALYGYAPVCGVKPVLVWKARVVGLKELPQGAAVGYNARYHAPRDMRTAVIAAGYADGLPRSLTNTGHIEIAGKLAPIVGAVSMDLTTIDVTDCGSIQINDEATIIGERITADDMAKSAGTISYEILTGIGNRVERVYSKAR
jgi:alanine racemase